MNWITNSIINCRMRKTNMLLWATSFVCVAIFSGCTKVNTDDSIEENVPSENIVVLQATANENDTKAELALDGGAFSWNTTDRIAVATSAGYKASTSEAVVSGADASFSVDLGGATLNTNAFALYPHTLVMNAAGTVPLEDCDKDHDGNDDNLVVYLPDTYTIGDVTSPKVPCPMIARNVAEGTMEFKQLCAMLCIKVNSVPKSAKSLVFDFNGKKVSGRFEIAANPTPGTSSIVADDNDSFDTIIVTGLDNKGWTDGLIINLPIPTGVASTNEFTTVKVTAKNSSSETVLEMTRPIKVGANWVPARATRRKIVASLPAFSVGDSKRVHIAKSNLKLHRPETETGKSWEVSWAAGKCTWEFMENAWSILGIAEISIDNINEIDVCHPSWGASGYNFNSGIEEEEDYIYGKYYLPWGTISGVHTDFGPKDGPEGPKSLTGDFAYGDWGVYACALQGSLDDGYGAFSTWRLPTKEEAFFLFGMTANDTDATEESDTRYSKRLHNWGFGRVNGVNGIIFVPDYFVDPTGIFYKTNAKIWPGGYSADRNVFESAQWALMEAAGAAFFPQGGLRQSSNDGHHRIIKTSGAGYDYWTSSSTHATVGNMMRFYPSGAGWYVVISTGTSRMGGANIRLVRDLN